MNTFCAQLSYTLRHGHELGQTLGDGEGQGSLVCYSPWNPEEPDTTWPTEQQKCRGSIMASIKDKDIQTSVLKQK